jgi:FkbM family methyltransferase
MRTDRMTLNRCSAATLPLRCSSIGAGPEPPIVGRALNRPRQWCVAAMTVAAASCGPTPQPVPPADANPATTPPAVTRSAPDIQCAVRGAFDPASGYYSQFYEDYVLSYVFKNVKNGVYVDVGANDPDVSSVTKYFYLSGWRGINFEPIPYLVERLMRSRPEDINLGIGVSDTVGELTFYQAQYSGLSTFDRGVMQKHKASGIGFQEIKIPVSTLNQVFEKHPLVQQGIAFLNADVEGFEKKVFSGIDFKRYQPHVIMAESTAPMTEVPTHQEWESILTAGGYIFALDDGLNRYYVHSSQAERLLPRFVEVNYCVGLDKLSKRIKLDGFKTIEAVQ